MENILEATPIVIKSMMLEAEYANKAVLREKTLFKSIFFVPIFFLFFKYLEIILFFSN